MPRRRLSLPDGLGQIFTLAEAERAGVSWGRLERHPQIRSPFSGVRVRIDPSDDNERPWEKWTRLTLLHAKAYARVMPSHAFISHLTAVPIHSLPSPRWAAHSAPDPAVIEASVLAPARALRAANVRSKQFQPRLCHVTEVDGVRVATAASTWAMLGDRLTVRELVELGDAIVRRPRVPPQPLADAPPAKATLRQLKNAMDAEPRAGLTNLRAAFPLIRQGSSSPLETDQRLLMHDAGLPEPALDHDVYSENGTLLGCSEIVYERLKIAVECEGDHHRTSRSQWDRDIQKYQAYSEAGWSVIRVTDRLVHTETTENLRRLRAMMQRAGWQPGDPT